MRWFKYFIFFYVLCFILKCQAFFTLKFPDSVDALIHRKYRSTVILHAVHKKSSINYLWLVHYNLFYLFFNINSITILTFYSQNTLLFFTKEEKRIGIFNVWKYFGFDIKSIFFSKIFTNFAWIISTVL